MTDKLKETVEHAIQELKQVVAALNGRRVWRGTYWEYTPILSDQYLKLRNIIYWKVAYLEEALREQEAARAKENADVARLEEKCDRLEPVAWIGQRKDGAVELTDTKPTESVMREFNMVPLYALPFNPRKGDLCGND